MLLVSIVPAYFPERRDGDCEKQLYVEDDRPEIKA